jgi:hypothetical protein
MNLSTATKEHEKVPNINNQQGTVNQKQLINYLTPIRIDFIKKIRNLCLKDIVKREPLYIVGRYRLLKLLCKTT